MAKFNKSNLTKLFKGFRPGIRVIHRINLQYLEKLEILTSLQHNIIQDALNRCTFTRTVKVGGKKDKEELVITFSNCYIARLFALLERPYNEAKVDHLGNPWSPSKPASDIDIEKMKEEHRKGLSRKDIKKEKE